MVLLVCSIELLLTLSQVLNAAGDDANQNNDYWKINKFKQNIPSLETTLNRGISDLNSYSIPDDHCKTKC